MANVEYGTVEACQKCSLDIQYVGTREQGWFDRGANFDCRAGGVHFPFSKANYRYIVQYDPEPDLSYLEDPSTVVTYGVRQEKQCEACEEWREVDSLWNIDVIEGTNEDVGEGEYDRLAALPPCMAEHFIEETE